MSERFTFRAAQTSEGAEYPIRIAIWGDMGSVANGAAILKEVTDVVENGEDDWRGEKR